MMKIPQEIDDFIKESIDYTLGLPVSDKTLELKLQASEEAQKRLRDQNFLLQARLKEKDETIELARSEASLNAQALKKFVEENQKLALECSNLLAQCSRLEKECSLYDHDREALMEFANEADERAKDAETRLVEVENELRRVVGELELRGYEHEMFVANETKASEELCQLRERISELERLRYTRADGHDDTNVVCGQCSLSKMDNQNLQSASMAGNAYLVSATAEGHLLDLLIASIIGNADIVANTRAFLEANTGIEPCQMLLKMWQRLRPSTKNMIALAAEVKTLQNDKEHLRVNLTRAEEEVKVLFEENNILDEENKRLVRLYNRERHHHQGSGSKHSSCTISKGNKRKSSPRTYSSNEMIDFDGSDSSRQPLSPLQHNSPESRMHKK